MGSPRNERDTQLGGENREFPSTHWSLIAGMQGTATAPYRHALESLCQRYWKPVYHYVRIAWSKSSEDAKDLTQAFFVRIFEGEVLKRYTPGRGGFRTYLKVLLRGFAADQHDALIALKRGGGVRTVALDGTPAPLGEFLADAKASDPEKLFDHAWKKEVLERAVERARQWFADAHRSVQFQAFEEYELAEQEGRPTYGRVAEKLGLSESDVRNYLFSVRERIRAEVRAELSQTVRDPAELDEEWKELFGG
ncbi:MAG TPA: sigma-70 family RNA polymerase sigma factor [Planctomycetota bacterium]|nr:sigma-70 family RNA polymerase sigma factor [Planctomycetota bacterium]